MATVRLDVVNRFTQIVHDFAWLDVIQCAVVVPADGASSTAILECLIRHRLYQHCYACADAESHVTESSHGPYRIDCIRPEDFIEISPTQFRASIRAHLAGDSYGNEPAEPAQVAAIEAFLDSLEDQPRQCFRLNKNPADESQQHDWGWVVDPFDEYVVLDTKLTSLALIVFGAD